MISMNPANRSPVIREIPPPYTVSSSSLSISRLLDGESVIIPTENVMQKITFFNRRNRFCCCIQKRHMLTALGFFGIFSQFTMLVNLSVAIVAMTDFIPPVAKNITTCLPPAELRETIRNGTHRHIQHPVFHWDTVTQGNILAAYFYGNICTMIPSGWISRRYGGKYVFGIGILLAGITTLITPKATELGGASALVALRVIEGLGTGCTPPAMHQLLSQWSPSHERTRLCAIIFTGAPVGTVFAMGISGVVGDIFGWQWIFYVFGAFSCVWFVFWVFFVSNTPNSHTTITTAEKELIACSNLTVRLPDPDLLPGAGQLKARDAPVPWRLILLSPAVWALFLGQFGHQWGNYTLLTNLPTYMKNIQQVQLSSNGLFSALPYIFASAIGVIGAFLSDIMIHRNLLSTTNTRKLCNTVGDLVPAVCVVGVGYVGCDWVTAVVLFTVGTGISGLTQAGFQVNVQDLSPIYAPVIFGMSTTLTAAFAYILPPHVVGAITASGQTEHNWRTIFYISGGIKVVTMLYFAVFASGEIAAWNYIGDRVPNVKPDTKIQKRLSLRQ